jgi:hypothetical protein
MGGIEMDSANLKLLGLVIDEPGFKVFEEAIKSKFDEIDTLRRVTDNSFQNGMLLGNAKGLHHVLTTIADLRKECHKMEEKR